MGAHFVLCLCRSMTVKQAAALHSVSDKQSAETRAGLVVRRVKWLSITAGKKTSHDVISEWWHTARFSPKEVWNLNGVRERKEWRHSLSGSVFSSAKHAHHSTRRDRVAIGARRNEPQPLGCVMTTLLCPNLPSLPFISTDCQWNSFCL